MAIVFKKAKKKNPIKPSLEKYYPELLTLGKNVSMRYIVYRMKELSSLSKGDIMSVVSIFLDVVRESLYTGHNVHLQDFGIFSLSARTEGSDTLDECTARKIKSIRINFRAAKSIRPDVNATRAEDKIDFIDLESYLKRLKGNNTGNNEEKDDPGWQDPNA